MFLLRGNQMIKQFIFCGSLGWCFEVFWTGLGSLFKHDKKLMGQSSLHMFPIYGSAIIIPPIHRLIRKANVFIRGTIYALCIFLTEFISGSFLKKRNACPWDYSDAALNYKGMIKYAEKDSNGRDIVPVLCDLACKL